MKNIETDFDKAKGKSILFLGRLNSFTQEEVSRFLEGFEITFSEKLTDDVAMVIEGGVLSPYDEELSYEAYKKKINAYPMKQFEMFYAKNLNVNAVLMSLKLSNDQERVLRLLKNESITDALFLKLLAIYDWHEQGVFESDENREVTTAFIKRFYRAERFDPAVIYSPTAIYDVILNSDDEALLETVMSFPSFTFKQSRSDSKKPQTILETVALNHCINLQTQKRLFKKFDSEIDYYLAQNSVIDQKLLEQLYERAEYETKKVLASNQNISDALFDKLLCETLESVKVLIQNQKITMERLDKIERLGLEEADFALVGKNSSLEEDAIETLLKSESILLLANLAANPLLKPAQLTALYALENKVLYPEIAKNENTPRDILEALFACKEDAIDIALAANESTPKAILDTFYARNELELNKALAVNASMSIEQLQQFQLDQSLKKLLVQNRTYTDNILNTLGI